MKVISNEAVFPLELEKDEYVAYRSFNENWMEYVVYQRIDNKTCKILARDKLHKVDHRKEIKEVITNYEITGIWTSYITPGIWTSYTTRKMVTDISQLGRKFVFQLDIKDNFSGELIQFTVLNKLPMSSYPRFNGTVLYCRKDTKKK